MIKVLKNCRRKSGVRLMNGFMGKIMNLMVVEKLPVCIIGIVFVLALGILMPFGIWAQNSGSFGKGQMVSIAGVRNLGVSCNKTCVLIFPAAIQSADRGAAYILASRVRGSENVLKVKAGRAGFEPSSLMVITKDGRVYAFNVSYDANPAYLVLDFRARQVHSGINIKSNRQMHVGDSGKGGETERVSGEKSAGKLMANEQVKVNEQMNMNADMGQRSGRGQSQVLDYDHEQTQELELDQITGNISSVQLQEGNLGPVMFSGVPLNSAEMNRCMAKIKEEPAFIKGVVQNRFGVGFRLEGVGYYKEVLFFKFSLQNKAGIPFKVESLRLFIRDRKKGRRTAVQDQELEALAIKSCGLPEQYGNDSASVGKGQQIIVAVPRFTIADDKQLAVVLREEQGDRNLMLMVKERKLRGTRILED